MKKRWLFLIFIILALVLCTPALSYAQGGYNYAKVGDVEYTALTTGDILEHVLNTVLSDYEKELLKNEDLTLKYSTAINVSNVSTEIDGDSLVVRLSSIKYKAQNGSTVIWLPYAVNGNIVDVVDGRATYTFNDISQLDEDTIDIKYKAEFVLNSEDINPYINLAYNKGQEASQKINFETNRYNQEYSQYLADSELYDNYLAARLQYERDYETYQNYLVEFNIWKAKSDAYDNYLSELAQYELELKAYGDYKVQLNRYNEDYQAYREYLSAYAQYESELAVYNDISSDVNIQTAIYQLGVLAYIDEPVTELNRTISGAILGDAVTLVLAERTALIEVGKVEKTAVDLASSATMALRQLLTQYHQCKTDAEKYAFYVLCHDELSKNFNDLLCALDFIYQYPDYSMVRKMIAQKERTNQFEILLAQLYCVCNALTTKNIPNYIMRYKGFNSNGAGYFDSSYTIGDTFKRTPLQVLGADGYLEAKPCVSPLEDGLPQIPQKPVCPDEVKEPIKPVAVSEPIKPDVVQSPPQKPEEVLYPIEPYEVSEPVEPIAYLPTPEEVKLKESFDSGLFEKRENIKGEVVCEVFTDLVKYFRNAKIVTVRFFKNAADIVPIQTEVAELGSSVEYSAQTPTMILNGYTCTFDGWVDNEGNKINLNRLSVDKGDLNLYPHFDVVANNYPVIWDIDGKKIECYYPYNTAPKYNEIEYGEIEKTRPGTRLYRFIGWSSNGIFYDKDEELPLVGDSTRCYFAEFESSYVITWVIDGMSESEAVWGGTLPEYKSTPCKLPTSQMVYTFVGWSSEILVADCDAVYTAKFDGRYYASSSANATNGASVSFKDGIYLVNCQSIIGKDYIINPILDVASASGASVEFLLSGTQLRFASPTIYELFQQKAYKMSIDAVMTSNYAYRYEVKFYDEDGNEVIPKNNVIEITSIGLFDFENSYLTATDHAGQSIDVRFKIQDNKLTFNAIIGYAYVFCPEYLIETIRTDNLDITVESRAKAGDKIKISIGEPPIGMLIDSIYVVDSDGNEIEIDEDVCFKMPAKSVSIGVVLAYCSYTVRFVADGKVVSTSTHKYGENIFAPVLPNKASDSEYSYLFDGWDKDIQVVTEDITYYAVYNKIPLTKEDSINTETKLSKIINIAYILVPCVIGLFVAVIILLIVIQFVKRKKLNR